MLSISALGGGGQRYYLELVNINYYSEGGEPPGRYYGLGARELGLAGTIEREHLERLANGFDHLTGEKLVQNAGVLKGPKARKPADDLTFSADKTVSAIWAVADKDLQQALQRMHDRAVRKALDFMQDRAGFARIRKNGTQLVRAPLIFALFNH